MWPHAFGSIFSARSGDTLRRNAVIMPLYTITLPLLFFVGFAAILIAPGLKNGDMALLTVVRSTFPPWFLGLVGGAGALTAMVPAAILILAAGTLFAKNFVRLLFLPSMSDDAVAKLAKIIVVVVTAMAMYFAIYSSSTLVRSAVVSAFVTCPDDIAKEIDVAFHESVAYVFQRHSRQFVDAKAN